MPTDLGTNIKNAREKAGLTQEELGAKIGVTGVTIMRYEKGTREPRLDVLKKLAAALGEDVYSIADWDTATALLEEDINKKDLQPQRSEITDDDLKLALFGRTDVPDEKLEEVKRYAMFILDK